MATYTVIKGDTLSEIAEKYNSKYKYGSTNSKAYKRLAAINNITKPYRIYVGQVIKLDNPKGSIKKPKNASTTPIVTHYGLQSNADNLIFATWSFNRAHTKEYKCKWWYSTGDGIWFVGSESTETSKQATYNPPSNAISVRFRVKPVASTHKVGKKTVVWWTGKWSAAKECRLSKVTPPDVPSAPSISFNTTKDKVVVKLENIADGMNAAKVIEFDLIRNGKSTKENKKVTISHRAASYSYSVVEGSTYKVRCRAIRTVSKKVKLISGWSDYSSEIVSIPGSVKTVKLEAMSSTSVKVTWSKASGQRTEYEIQYTTKVDYFDHSSDMVTSIQTGAINRAYYVTGMDTGTEYFFRVRAVNETGNSKTWSEIKSITLGLVPAAPTTWSSTTTVVTGERLMLYWVHNAEDGSKATKSKVYISVNGVDVSPEEETYVYGDEDTEKTHFYIVDTSSYTEGAKIEWKVKTAGATGVYGDWSVTRTVDIYAQPTLEMNITNQNGDNIDSITRFPFYVKGLASPATQSPIAYQLTVTSTEDYETIDPIGNPKNISSGDEVFSKLYDIKTELNAMLSADNIDLENGITYKIQCIVTMNSGLTAEATAELTVDWVEEEYSPDADIIYDEETYSCSIRPYCFTIDDSYYPEEDSDDDIIDENTPDNAEQLLVQDITLSVYRRDYNGEYIEIATGLDNLNNTYVTDPHPALDYGRYRIVATSKTTGAVSYYDTPGLPINEHSIIIQWNESWENLVTSVEDNGVQDDVIWSGSRVILPYNIDVTEKNNLDVSLVEYIGRKRPVSYYGTQIGETSSWKVEIPKEDTDTLYALRRLAIWTGDVYVREPSGSGYWASISVSFSQTHCQVTIPVTLELTRVEGGV